MSFIRIYNDMKIPYVGRYLGSREQTVKKVTHCVYMYFTGSIPNYPRFHPEEGYGESTIIR